MSIALYILLVIPLGCALYLFAVAALTTGYGGPNSPGWRWRWKRPKQPDDKRS